MVRLRYALIVAAAIVLASVWFSLHQAGYSVVRYCDQFAGRLEVYGLYGYSILCRTYCAGQYVDAARASAANNPDASRASADSAADQLLHVARLLRSQQADDRALILLERARSVAPSRADVEKALTSLAFERDMPGARESIIDAAFIKEQPWALALVADSFAARGRHDDAVGCLRLAAKKAPDDFAIQLALARALIQAGDTGGSLQAAQAAADLAEATADRVAAGDALRAAGGAAPSRASIFSHHIRREFGVTALVALAYLLFLIHPWLGAIAGRFRRK